MKSNKTEILGFDEWLDTTKLRGYMDENSLEASWEAGQQSKQDEIDELQKRVDLALNKIYFWVSSENGDAAYVANSIGSILKGDQS